MPAWCESSARRCVGLLMSKHTDRFENILDRVQFPGLRFEVIEKPRFHGYDHFLGSYVTAGNVT